jgi:hypothetical protein
MFKIQITKPLFKLFSSDNKIHIIFKYQKEICFGDGIGKLFFDIEESEEALF